MNLPLQHNILFRASAGTGKTYNVVSLYSALLLGEAYTEPGTDAVLCEADPARQGIAPDRILLMTFTENAAAELRVRAAQFLERRLVDLLTAPDSDPAYESLISTRLRQLAAAPVCTIHAFCARVLRENALAAGISPRFRLLEGEKLKELRDLTLYETITAGIRQDKRLGALAELLGLPRLQELADSFLNELEACRIRLDPASSDARNALFELTPPGYESLRNLVRALPENIRKNAVSTCLDEWDVRSRRSLDHEGIIRLAKAIDQAQKSTSSRPEIAAIQKWAARTLAAHFGKPYFDTFLALVAACQTAFTDAKSALGGVDFQDLITFAVQLFSTHHELTSRPDEPNRPLFDVIIVDEVQDNSRLQYHLLKCLWKPPLNRLAVCGDTKQSIYAWRNADIQVLPDLAKDMAAASRTQNCPAKDIHLQTSFRSHDALIHSLNTLAETIYGIARNEDESSEAVPDWCYADESLRGREVLPSAERRCPSIELLLPDWQAAMQPDILAPFVAAPERTVPWQVVAGIAGNDVAAAEPQFPFARNLKTVAEDGVWQFSLERDASALISAEALAVARRIRLMTSGSGSWQPPFQYAGDGKWVSSRGSDTPVCYRDILVLLKRTAHQTAFEEAFRHLGIPYSISGRGRGFFQRPEVRDICSLLQVILNPGNRAALVALLRSPFAGLSDLTVAEITSHMDRRRRDEEFTAVFFDSEPPAQRLRVSDNSDLRRIEKVRSLLQRARELARTETVVDMTRSLIRDSGFDAIQAGASRGNARLANIRKLLDWLAMHEKEGMNTLSSLARMLQDHITKGTEEAEAAVYDPSENAVQIMTIHAAKGLTQRVVFVPDLRAPSRHAAGNLFVRKDGLIDFRLNVPDDGGESLTAATNGFAESEQQALDDAWRESQNLFYVAITRARDLVVLSGDTGSKDGLDSGSWRGWLNRYLATACKEKITPAVSFRSYGQLASAMASAPVTSPDPPAAAALAAAEQAPFISPPADPGAAAVALPATTFCHILARTNRVEKTAASSTPGTPPASAAPVPRFNENLYSAVSSDLQDADESGQRQFEPDPQSNELGSAAHKLLENLDWKRPLPTQFREFSQTLQLPAAQRRDVERRMLLALDQHPAFFARIAGAAERYPEMPFGMNLTLPAANYTLHGVMDLVCREPQGWLLVDYKFTSADSAAELRERYVLQMATYWEALRRMTGEECTAMILAVAPGTAHLLSFTEDELKDAFQQGVEALISLT